MLCGIKGVVVLRPYYCQVGVQVKGLLTRAERGWEFQFSTRPPLIALWLGCRNAVLVLTLWPSLRPSPRGRMKAPALHLAFFEDCQLWRCV